MIAWLRETLRYRCYLRAQSRQSRGKRRKDASFRANGRLVCDG